MLMASTRETCRQQAHTSKGMYFCGLRRGTMNRVTTTISFAMWGRLAPLPRRPGKGFCLVSTEAKAQHSQYAGASQHRAAREH